MLPSEHHPRDRVLTLTRSSFAPFLSRCRDAVVLLGSAPGSNFFPPITHQLSELSGGALHFASLQLPDLADRAWVLPAVARVFRDQPRLRAARRGYYLFLDAQAVGYHPGLYDEGLAADLERIDRCMATERLDEALVIFQRVAREVVRSVVTHFEALLPQAARRPRARISPHAVLGIGRDASLAEIRSAYRRLLRENHPDHLPRADSQAVAAAHQRTQVIIQAYRALTRSA